MRGDHSSDATDAEPFQGLPPHAWGPREGELPQPLERRSTPTCVGTTDSLRIGDQTVRVYPHMRGDHSRRLAKCRSSTGLPPHAWGPLPRWRQGPAAGGSTPTCVGTTQVNVSPRARTRVYPHMRGDHVQPLGRHRHLPGLPPQAWGPPPCPAGGGDPRRSTPTCVGTTTGPPPVRPAAPVYPHMRGDHCARCRQTTRPGGLPPHAWGPPPCCFGCWRRWRWGAARVYPHMRGDHVPYPLRGPA